MKMHYLALSLAALSVAAATAVTASGEDPLAKTSSRKASSNATVLDFGAIGDGISDDTDAIQSLIDSKAGSIRFPAGTYRISKPLVLELNKIGFTTLIADGSAQLLMVGPGPAIRVENTWTGTAPALPATSDARARRSGALVNGLSILGDHAEADGIEAAGTIQLTLRGVSIRQCHHGVRLSQRNSSLQIENCNISENTGCGICLDHVTLNQASISATQISHCGGAGIVIRGGEVRSLRLTGCDLEYNGKENGPGSANVLVDSADGQVTDIAITGCTLRHSKQIVDSANIRILGPGNKDTPQQPPTSICARMTIGNNAMSEAQTNIHLMGVRGVTIVGNTLCQGYTHNALIDNSAEVLLGQNAFTRQPQYKANDEGTNDVVFLSCRDCTIQDLQLCHVKQSEAGLTLDKCDRMHVDDCTILECDNVGILVRDCTRCRVDASNFIHHSGGAKSSIPIKSVRGSGNRVNDMEHFYAP